MKRSDIWHILLFFGALSSIMCSCGRETEDGVRYHDHIYKNATSHQLKIAGYSDKFGTTNPVETWNIAPSESIVFHFEVVMGSLAPAPVFCDSVRLEFDGQKELWYRRADGQPGNLLEYGSEIKVDKRHTRFLHVITDSYYDKATPRP